MNHKTETCLEKNHTDRTSRQYVSLLLPLLGTMANHARVGLGCLALVIASAAVSRAAESLFFADINAGVYQTDTDGTGLHLDLPMPYAWGVAFDASGNLFVSHLGGPRAILKIDFSGSTPVTTTFVNWPFGGTTESFFHLAFDAVGNLYASSGVFSGKVYKIDPSGSISTMVLAANYSYGLTFDAAGSLYVATYANGKILKVDPTTGTQSVFFQLPAGWFFPHGLAFDSAGNLFVSDPIVGGRILKINATGTAYSEFVTGLSQPRDLVFDGSGNLLVTCNADRTLRKISPLGVVTTILSGLSSPNGLVIGARNGPPTAVAGPDQSIHAGTTVYLDGSNSFDDNTPAESLEFSWSIVVAPPGNTAVLDGASTAIPTLTPNVAGEYVVQLIVTDDGAPSLSSDPALVTLSSFNQAPMAAFTSNPPIPYVGQSVSLDGSGSADPEGDTLDFAWAITNRPAESGAQLVGVVAPFSSFEPDISGTYEVTLTVSDFLGAGTPATHEIVVTTGEAFAESQIAGACELVDALSANQVTTAGNRTAFCQFLSQALSDIQKENVAQAIFKLREALARTDGCALRGTPDTNGPGRDWITNENAQVAIYAALNSALQALLAQ